MTIRRQAFTLIELLVVIAIIALLLAILLPSLRKAKGIAQQVICMSNCKTFGLANAMYAYDYSGCFVSNNDSTMPLINDRWPIWCTNQAYINYLAISNDETAWSVPANSFILPDKFQCPSARLRDEDDYWVGNLVIRTSYAMNGYTRARFFSGEP
jgi:prepilin-type N-terminal cleavage/methylation domain-containing protein